MPGAYNHFISDGRGKNRLCFWSLKRHKDLSVLCSIRNWQSADCIHYLQQYMLSSHMLQVVVIHRQPQSQPGNSLMLGLRTHGPANVRMVAVPREYVVLKQAVSFEHGEPPCSHLSLSILLSLFISIETTRHKSQRNVMARIILLHDTSTHGTT